MKELKLPEGEATVESHEARVILSAVSIIINRKVIDLKIVCENNNFSLFMFVLVCNGFVTFLTYLIFSNYFMRFLKDADESLNLIAFVMNNCVQ